MGQEEKTPAGGAMQNAHALPISSAPGPGQPPTITSFVKAPGHRFGRTAMLIHLLAWLAFSTAWLFMIALGELSPESQAIQGVGGATALTFVAWSGLLAFRAIWHGERIWVPTLVLVLVAIEGLLPCIWLWDPLLTGNNPLSPLFEFVLWAGLPLFVPFLVFGSVLAVPVAWIGEWIWERWKSKRKPDGWTRHRRLKVGFVMYLAVFLLLVVTVFPYALYAYVALEQNHRKIWSSPFNWQAPVLSSIPDFIRTGLDEFCSKRLPWRFVRHRVALIETGQLPKERLLINMGDSWEEVQAASWRTYFRDYTPEAMTLCRTIMKEGDAERRYHATWGFWHVRTVFGTWGNKTRCEYVDFLIGQLGDPDYRVRRGCAHVLSACLNKPTSFGAVPWPWGRGAPSEQDGEAVAVQEVRAFAQAWLDSRRQPAEPKE
jgi:hypothetical protein